MRKFLGALFTRATVVAMAATVARALGIFVIGDKVTPEDWEPFVGAFSAGAGIAWQVLDERLNRKEVAAALQAVPSAVEQRIAELERRNAQLADELLRRGHVVPPPADGIGTVPGGQG
jgi:hypothetical protein